MPLRRSERSEKLAIYIALFARRFGRWRPVGFNYNTPGSDCVLMCSCLDSVGIPWLP